MKKLCIFIFLILSLGLMTACGGQIHSSDAVPVTPSPVISIAPLSTPVPSTNPNSAVIPTTVPTVIPTAAPMPASTPTPIPTVIPTPTPVPTPTPTPRLPMITKSPTDEIVDEGGSCWFIAKYENATVAVWHFLSPDRQTDLTYEAAQRMFPTMEILNGMYSNLQLKNIPYSANGWRVYCRYSNSNGYTDTGMALITVRPNPNPTPTPAPNPTSTPAPAVVTILNYSGRWTDDGTRTVDMLIYQDKTSVYTIEISWVSSFMETHYWTMSAVDNGSGKLVYSNGSHTVTSSDGGVVQALYSGNGRGSFQFNDEGKLVWNSEMEDVAKGIVFVTIQ